MVTSSYRPCLVVYVAWHPENTEGKDFAEHIYSRVSRDIGNPISRGIGIPVFFRSVPLPQKGMPPEIPLDEAQHSAVVVLVDNKVVSSDPWNDYIEDLWKVTGKAGSPHRVYPVSMTQHAFNLKGDVPRANFIRLHDKPIEDRQSFLSCILIHELCRLLLNRKRTSAISGQEFSPAPVKLFISHAKRDGLEIAKAVRDYIYRESPLKTFFDANDITSGYAFDEEIYAQMEDAALLAIVTDVYASREWCRREIVAAKRLGIPIVVVNAVAKGEERAFPYVGNAPTIRWHPASLQLDEEALKGDIDATIHLMLHEVLKSTYWRHHFADLGKLSIIPESAVCLLRPPELLDLIKYSEASARGQAALLVYPDPPLGTCEAELLASLVPGLKLSTPVFLGGR